METVPQDKVKPKKSGSTIWSFELFRLYFLICVMFTHLTYLLEPTYDSVSTIMNFGRSSVTFFFILSGFFMYRSIRRYQPQGQKEAIKLALRKSIHYFVLYFMRYVLLIIYQLFVYFYAGIHSYSLSDIFTNFFRSLSMLDVYVPLKTADVGWFFRALLFQFLLCYPMYRFTRSRSRKKRYTAAAGLILLHLAVSAFTMKSPYFEWFTYYCPYIHTIDYLIGMLIAAEAEEPEGVLSLRQTGILQVLSLVLVFTAQFVIPYYFHDTLFRYEHFIALVVMSILIYAFSRNEGALAIKQEPFGLSRLHRHFFSLYILHDIIIKYSSLIPWSSSKYLNLLFSVIMIIVLDDLVLFRLCNRVRHWILGIDRPPTDLFFRFVHNPFLFYTSLLCSSLLISPVSIRTFLLLFAVAAAVMILLRKYAALKDVLFSITEVLFSFLALTVMFLLFREYWVDYALFAQAAGILHLTPGEFTDVFGICLCFGAFPSLLYSIHLAAMIRDKKTQSLVAPRPAFRREMILILFSAVLAVTIVSKSSPLYPLNDWDDANIFFTVGKAVLYGKVPYRDLLDHKGPIIYFLHTLAAAVSFRTFTGVWIIELVSFAVYLYYSWKTCYLFCGKRSILAVPFIAAATVFTNCFWLGDSAEELCLPFLVITAYIYLKHLADASEISRREYVIIGLLTGLTFWIKYTLLGLVIGTVCYSWWRMIRKRQAGRILPSILYLGLGFLIPTVPVLLYFAVHHALNDLFYVYFYANIFGYGLASTPIHIRILNNLVRGLKYNRMLCWLSVLALFTLYFQKKEIRIWGTVTYLTMIFFVYFGDAFFLYYPLPLVVLYPFAACAILNAFPEERYPVLPRLSAIAPASLAILAVFGLIYARPELKFRREDYPQFRFLPILEEAENPTLLEYSFQGAGLYTVSGIVPECREFVRVNMNAEEVMYRQDRYIETKHPDFILTRNRKYDFENYELVAEEHYTGQETPAYYLYRYNAPDGDKPSRAGK